MKDKIGQGAPIEYSAGSEIHTGVATRVYTTLEKGAKDVTAKVVARMTGKKGAFVFDAYQVNRGE